MARIAILITSILVVFAFCGAAKIKAQQKTKDVVRQPTIESLEELEFYQKLIKAIETGHEELAKILLKHSTKRVRLTESRRDGQGREIKYSYDDFASKEISLKIFNLATHGSLIVRARKVGQGLVSTQPELIIQVEDRPSGIVWNDHNTAYRVRGVNGNQWAVILNNFPNRLKNGRRKDALYSPYSTALHLPVVVRGGRQYLDQQIALALFELQRLQAAADSRFDILQKAPAMVTHAMAHLALIEHADFFEFKEFLAGRWPHSPFERVFVILGLNRGNGFSLTFSNKVRAAGLMQATNRGRKRKPGTWDMIRTTYPWAKLPSFREGALNHKQALKFAMLLQDYNLNKLIEEFGKEILNDPELEHYLAAAYNGGVGHVIRAKRESHKNGTSWRQKLAKIKKTSENLDYLEKLDYLLKNSTN